MAGYNLSETVAPLQTGHIGHTNAVHDIVNKFDKDAVPTNNQALVWSSATSLYLPQDPQLPRSSPARNPLTGMVHASAFGMVSDGVADNSSVFNAIQTAIGNKPARIWLGAEPGGKGIIGITQPIIMHSGQEFIGPAISDGGADHVGYAVTVKALATFTGDAMFQSATWTGGGGGTNNWHWGSIEGMRINCDHQCDYGIAVHQMGENAVIRRVLVQNADDTNIMLTGAHAPCTLEHVSTFSATNYGVKLTTHPAGGAYTGNSGVVSFTELSGDNNAAAHIYIDGAQSVDLSGWKSEGHTVGVLIAGSNTPNIHATGYFSATLALGTEDVFKITGTAAPRITSAVRTAAALNYLNDTVNSVTIPAASSTVSVPALVTYGDGRTVISTSTLRSRISQTRTGNGHVTIDTSKGDFHEITLAGNATGTTLSNGIAGHELTLTYIQDATGSRTYVWPTITWAGSAPTNLKAPNLRDTVRLMYDGTAWVELSRSQESQPTATPPRSGRYIAAPFTAGQITNGVLSLNSLRYMPFVIDRVCTITAIGAYIPATVASSTIRLGIYADGDGEPTGAPLVDAGTISGDTATGFKEITGLSVAVTPGRYWAAAVTQGAAAQVAGVLGVTPGVSLFAGYTGADQTSWVHSSSVTGALPTAAVNSHGRGALINLKIA